MRHRTFTLEPTRESWRVRAAVGTCVTLVAGLALWAVGCGDASRAESRTAQTDGSTSPLPAGAVAPVERAPAPTPAITGPVSFRDARAAFRAERYEDAVALFTVYTVEHPEDAAGFYMLGVSQWKTGQHDLAVPALEQAVTLDSTHVRALYNLTRVLLETEKAEEALPRIERAVALDSTASEGRRLLGRTQTALLRFADAIESYRQAIVLDSADAWSMHNLALVLVEQGRIDEALPLVARAVELKPASATFQNSLGVILEQRGYFTAAAEAFRGAIALDSTFTKAVENLTRVEGKPDAEGLPPLDLKVLAGSVGKPE